MNDEMLHQHLDMLLQLRRTCQRLGASGEAVQALLRHVLVFVRDLMTQDVFSRAMKSGQDGEGLLLLANRVQLLAPLLEDGWPPDFTFNDLVGDLFGIANGDAPRVLKSRGKKGQFRNAHALLEKKLDAHGWYKVLGALKLNASARQALLIDSYGVTLDAFNKWRAEAKSKLTTDYVDRYLVSFLRNQTISAALSTDPVAWATERTREAGKSYQAELKALQA